MGYLRGDESREALMEQMLDDDLHDDAMERLYRAKEADILLHLTRMRAARLGAQREPNTAHERLGEYYRSMGRVVDLLDDLRIEGRPVPAFLQEIWDAERRA